MKLCILFAVALAAVAFAEVPLNNEHSPDWQLHNYILNFLPPDQVSDELVEKHIAEVNQTAGTTISHVFKLGSFRAFSAHLEADVLAQERTRDDLYEFIEVDGRAHIPPVLTNPDSPYANENEFQITFWDFYSAEDRATHMTTLKERFSPKSFVRTEYHAGEIYGYTAHLEDEAVAWELKEIPVQFITHIHYDNSTESTSSTKTRRTHRTRHTIFPTRTRL
ncbi:hypothetical protein PROFUN_05748 [Planoprotostelium fungivorum]|uniref:Inhibitor I9 domain-containing protein n=1 Tax=Planoprotostelium fungivorum TaxID=1890364 RepID=A0A2P6NQK1_9EUKA|nr:hypothetical protein PROFUN_05748 [Planoprotostelium fungivorum]